MGKDYYDDMQDRPSRRSSRDTSGNRPNRGLIWTIALGIAICVVVIVIWYQFFPAQQQSQGKEPVVIEQVLPQVEKIADAPTVVAEEQIRQPQAQPSFAPDTQARALTDRPASELPTSSRRVQYADHVVAEGQDLADIAALYNLKTQTLISVNQIRNIQAIREGVVLKIPDRDGQLYTVREGDMLSTIARKFSPSLGWKTLQEVNALSSEIIRVGQQLFIPDTSSSAMAQLADVAPIQFSRPASGVITTLFGQPYLNTVTGVTENLDGIFIVGNWGSAVVASAPGQVVDAGYEVKGRGRFVILSHEGGYRTSYYHLENVEVRTGMTLTKGQVIGSIGTSGTSYDRPTLYFKIEQSGIALDPSQFF